MKGGLGVGRNDADDMNSELSMNIIEKLIKLCGAFVVGVANWMHGTNRVLGKDGNVDDATGVNHGDSAK